MKKHLLFATTIIIQTSSLFFANTSSAQTVSTLAGSGYSGFTDATGTAAQFSNPTGIAIDVSGNVYVGDRVNNRIRKITPAGVVSTLAGVNMVGFLDGNGTVAQFSDPNGVAVDASGNVYVGDKNNHRVRKVTPASVVSTFAGNSTAGYTDGTGTSAQFYSPVGIAVDTTGNVFVADFDNHRIRKITPLGVVSTIAGSGTAGFADGTGTAAQFNYPAGVAVDASGNIFVADAGNNKIRKITPAGVVSTVAGSTAGFTNGTGTAAQFNYPTGVAVDAYGNILVADEANNRIRLISPNAVVSTLAGSTIGFTNGIGTAAQFQYPYGVAIDASANVYVADMMNNSIRKITTSVSVSNFDVKNNVKIYPNPASVSFTIECTGLSNAKLQVMDIVGKELMKQSFSTDSYTLNIENLPAGMYLIKLSCEQGTATEKIIKN